jgi:1-acyl-sn-glycerol-3-phosphate acyltransferase
VRLRPFYFGGWFITRLSSWLFFNPCVLGREHIPRDGGFIMASNHISYYDPPLLGSWQRRQMYFFAKQELFRNRLFGAIIRACNSIPVKRGTIDRQAVREAVEVIQKGYGLVVFPEGTRSRTKEFLPPKAGLGMLARTARCPIVPAYLHGNNRLKDCLLRRTRMTIVYGEPFSAEWVASFPDEKASYQAMTEAVMERISQLRDQVARLS